MPQINVAQLHIPQLIENFRDIFLKKKIPRKVQKGYGHARACSWIDDIG
jgi:hypothetical protein